MTFENGKNQYTQVRIRNREVNMINQYFKEVRGATSMSFAKKITTLAMEKMGAVYLQKLGATEYVSGIRNETKHEIHVVSGMALRHLQEIAARDFDGEPTAEVLNILITDAYRGVGGGQSRGYNRGTKTSTKAEDDTPKINYATLDIWDYGGDDLLNMNPLLELDRTRLNSEQLSDLRQRLLMNIDSQRMYTEFEHPLIREIGDKVKDKWRELKAKHPLASSLMQRYVFREDPVKMDLTNLENIVSCYLNLFHLEHQHKTWEQFDLDVKAYDAIIDPMTVQEMIEYTKTNFSPPVPIPSDWILDHANIFGLVREGGNLKQLLKPQCLEFFCKRFELGDYTEMRKAKREELKALYGL